MYAQFENFGVPMRMFKKTSINDVRNRKVHLKDLRKRHEEKMVNNSD